MPHDRSLLTRRDLLRDIMVAGVAVGVTVTAAACQQTPDTDPEVDDLQSQLDLATRDSASAAAAAAANPPLAPELTAVAAIRRAHGAALTKELQRATGSTSTRATSTTATSAAPPPGVDQVKAQLRSSARSALDSAVRCDGYRAGLLASISAACASAAEVDLA